MKFQILKCFAAVMMAWTVSTVVSNQVAAQDNPGTAGLVTVLDVAKVFDENPTFKQKMDAIKSEADSLKNTIQEEQEAIRKDAMKLQDFEIASPQRNELERSLEHRQTELKTKARQSEQDLLTREAVIYYETYRQMQDVVASIAKENGISLVLRFDSNEMDRTNRNEVIKGVNRTVVFHSRLDLTSLVSDQMNKRSASAAGSIR